MSGMYIGYDGVHKFVGDGTWKVVVTGNVIYKNNNLIGDLHDIVNKAVETCENLSVYFGLIAGT